MTQKLCELSLVLVTYNSRKFLDSCLSSLAAGLEKIPHEIIVVDNASQDGTADRVAEAYPGVRLFRNSENLGYPKANNQGIAAASGPFILLLNPDTEVIPGVLERLLAEIKLRPDAGGVAPVLRLPSGAIQVSFGKRIGLGAEIIKKLVGNRFLSRQADRKKEIREMGWLGGACLLTRKEALEGVKGFDEHFFLYFEDIDLCYRIREAGWKLWLLPELQIRHLGGGSTSGASLFSRFHYRRSQLYFYRKHARGLPRLGLKLYLILTFVGLYIKGALEHSPDMESRRRFFSLLREK
jgi:GT2 family glycosyltransferase